MQIAVKQLFCDARQRFCLTCFRGRALLLSMKTIETIFDELGGPAKVASLLGVKHSTASEMKRRSVIRVCYWPTLVKVCRDRRIKGVNYNTLVELHQNGDKQ